MNELIWVDKSGNPGDIYDPNFKPAAGVLEVWIKFSLKQLYWVQLGEDGKPDKVYQADKGRAVMHCGSSIPATYLRYYPIEDKHEIEKVLEAFAQSI